MPKCDRRKFAVTLLCLVIILLLVQNEYLETNSHGTRAAVQRLIDAIPGNVFPVQQTVKVSCSLVSVKLGDINVRGHDIEFLGENSIIKLLENTTKEPQEPLQVFVVPHSHVDPGWLQTYDEYFEQKVKNILDYAVDFLSATPRMRFIWSEISFLKTWWDGAEVKARDNLVRLINNGQFEITGGAWVMTDEATPYFWSSIDNMIEGHRFLKQTFGIVPNCSWSVDPFGHGLMVPLLLNLAGIRHMVIGRISNQVKDIMKNHHRLHFNWRQTWDTNGEYSAFVNTLPRSYYTTIDACGPDSSICCQYDVGISARTICARRAHNISEKNVDEFATQLARQYRLLQPYYNSNAVLVPIGDDFYFGFKEDWPLVYENMIKIFNYINGQSKYNMKVQFSTVSEYFNAVKDQKKAPSLTGDFFPYLDFITGYPYWTGYFTHRPYHKRVERILQAQIRSLDLLSVFSKSKLGIPAKIETARRNLALFQHHDAITGTSTRLVMQDYLKRLLAGMRVIRQAQLEQISNTLNVPSLNTTNEISPKTPELLPQKTIDMAKNQRFSILVFNQLSTNMERLIELEVNQPKLTVVDQKSGDTITAQIEPIFSANLTALPDKYKLVFLANLKAFSITKFEIVQQSDQPNTTVIAIEASNSNTTKFTMSNKLLHIVLSNTGQITHLSHKKAPKKIQNLNFTTQFENQPDNGGSYTFRSTSKKAEPLPDSERPSMVHLSGPIRTVSHIRISPWLRQTFSLLQGDSIASRSLRMELWPDMTKATDLSMIWRMHIAINNSNQFFTDVNGMFLIDRYYTNERPIEANYYPMATTAMIQDVDWRLSILGGQPAGASSRANGQLEVMIDRILKGDDGKGLAWGEAFESFPSHLHYRILIEPRSSAKTSKNSLYHSMDAHLNLQDLIYPPETFVTQDKMLDHNQRIWSIPSLPCDIQLINLRYLTQCSLIVLLRRIPLDCSIDLGQCATKKGSLASLFNFLKPLRIFETSLTGVFQYGDINAEDIEDRLDEQLLIRAFKVVICEEDEEAAKTTT